MTRKMTLEVSADDDDVTYLILPDHPRDGVAGISGKQIRLRDLLEYVGPDIYFDFDEGGKLIGAEILA